uniref:G_PROTEIN_RECEP_F1_2 domain-containing protein n=1 Tax=Steinernema glaseri TaxID=37863 RepID=A0A1I7XY72_9BILA
MVVIPYAEVMNDTVVNAWYYSVQISGIVVVCLFIIFYILSIVAICRYRVGAYPEVTHRRHLISVIVYATMPGILAVFGLVVNVLMYYVASLLNEKKTANNPIITMGASVNQGYRYAIYARVPILTISTFIAFASYRSFLMSWFSKGRVQPLDNTDSSEAIPRPLSTPVVSSSKRRHS